MSTLSWINVVLDGLPRTRVLRHFRPAPAFRSLGVTGFYAAAVVTFLVGLVDGRSPLVLAALSAVCGLSFFAWALVRKWLSGREQLVLLEHVWFALACAAALLWVLGEPIPGYLDAVAAGLCVFLAFGRLGCTVAGCCHGPPSSVGIVYPPAAAAEGFERRLTGVRLFPTQVLELVTLLILGVVVTLVTCLAADGLGILIFLCGYAIARFGLEGLRFDRRPHLLGLSQSRWMALVELTVAIAAWEHAHGRLTAPRDLALWAGLGALLVVALIIRARVDPSRRVGAAQATEVRELAQRLAEHATAEPRVDRTRAGHSVGVSRGGDGLHVSVADASGSLWLACQLVAGAWPSLTLHDAIASERGVVHLRLHATPVETAAAPDALALYGHVTRMLQLDEAEAPTAATPSAAPLSVVRSSYFGQERKRSE